MRLNDIGIRVIEIMRDTRNKNNWMKNLTIEKKNKYIFRKRGSKNTL